MSFNRINASAATVTRTRTESSPGSGMCVVCLDGCPGTCEIGMSALRGREMLYPQPFGQVTAGSAKDYPVDFSHFIYSGKLHRRKRRGGRSRWDYFPWSGSVSQKE